MAGRFDPFATYSDRAAGQQQSNTEDITTSLLTEAAKEDKPFFAQDVGQFVGDLGKIAANAGVGLVTDYMDLAAGLVDVGVQSASYLTGNGWDWNQVFNDADNPWTQARREAFETETQAGEIVSNLTRLGVSLASLPKIGIKGLALAPTVVSKVGALGPVAGGAGKVASKLNKLDDVVKAGRYVRTTDALADVGKGFKKGTDAARAAKIGSMDDWLTMTFKEVASVKEGADWLGDLRNSTKALTQLTREKAKFRTVAEALAWDAFVAFNVSGEGDWSFDETLSDTLAEFGLPRISGLETDLMDSPLERKIKQMAEGLAIGGVLSGLMDMNRVYRFSRNFRKAGPEEQAQIIKALNAEADDIGKSIAGLGEIGLAPQGWSSSADGWMTPSTKTVLSYQPGGYGFGDPNVTGEFAVGSAGLDAKTVDPWYQGGALARLDAGLNTERIAQNYQRDLDVAWLRANANSPVQNRLAQMEGLASQLNDDPLYQEWLASRAPGEAFMPPQAGGNPALEQFQAQGAMPTPSQQGGPDDLAAYEAWLQERARMPGAEMDPRVQQSLRRLEGIGELALRQEQGPGQLLPTGGIEPVRVQDITPRPPEAVVTPQTIKNAFAQDAAAAFRRAQQLTLEEGPDGVFRPLRKQVEQLMPRTRVDSIEYIQNFKPVSNEVGMISASDSVWMNFITNRGLTEGWASIDPDTMAVRFNRKAAFELDRGAAAIKQAEALDEAIDIDLFNQRFAGQIEQIEQQKNELFGQMEEARYDQWLADREPMNPGSGDPQVQDRLAQMEVNDQYDAWEADVAARDAERRAVTAEVEKAQLEASEEVRLSEAEVAAAAGDVDDKTLVRELLGQNLDTVEAPEVAKADIGRQWEVIAADGEVIATSRTKREADKLAAAEQQRLKDAMVARARQMEADATDEVINIGFPDPLRDSDVMGKVTLTPKQIERVSKYSEAIRRQLAAKATTKTFNLTQGEMYDLADGLRALLQTGEFKGTDGRLLRNTLDRLDVGMKLIEPEVRAQMFADNVAADAQRFLSHGDFC